MAGTNNPEYPIPMLDTAEAIVDTDEAIEPFVLSLFPDANPSQIAMIRLFAISWFMEGEEMGRLLANHNATDDIPHSPSAETMEFDPDARDISRHLSYLPLFCLDHQQKIESL